MFAGIGAYLLKEEWDRQKRQDEANERLIEILQAMEEDPEGLIHAYMRSVESQIDLNSYYRPKRGERVVAVFVATMARMVTETRAYSYGGLTTSIKIWGPVRYRSGHIRVHRVQRERLKDQGRGLLIVTSKKLIFNAFGHGKDWSRTWNSISTWGVYADAVQVELSNGKPLVFIVDPTDAFTHPGFVSAIFSYAHDL